MHTAVIDLGKTNKKVAIIDQSLALVADRQMSLPARPDGDGVLVESVEAIWDWLKVQLRELYRTHPFAAIAVTTHGATWAAIDGAGELAMPVLAYEHDLGEAGQRALDQRFYGQFGPLTQLQAETGTCDLPLLINPAKGLLFAQEHWPAGWAATTRLLDYPQFWGFRLTGIAAAEATSACNHTFLVDPVRGTPSSVARGLGLGSRLDLAFRQPWAQLGTLTAPLQVELGLPALPVAVGIHDSNASLLPYLVTNPQRDFVLVSTGTWCVAMHRIADATEARLQGDELGRTILVNRDPLGGLSKVSILMGGQEYALYHGLIAGASGAEGHGGPVDPARLDAALEPTRMILPGACPGQFPRARGGLRDQGQTITLERLRSGEHPPWFADPVAAHDLLNASLALQSEVAIRATGLGPDTAVFVEGGFRNNPGFLAYLAGCFPEREVRLTNLAQATSSGTALLGQALVAGCAPTDFADRISIEEQPVTRIPLPRLATYRAAWQSAAG